MGVLRWQHLLVQLHILGDHQHSLDVISLHVLYHHGQKFFATLQHLGPLMKHLGYSQHPLSEEFRYQKRKSQLELKLVHRSKEELMRMEVLCLLLLLIQLHILEDHQHFLNALSHHELYHHGCLFFAKLKHLGPSLRHLDCNQHQLNVGYRYLKRRSLLGYLDLQLIMMLEHHLLTFESIKMLGSLLTEEQ